MKVVKLNAKVRTEFSKGATNKLRSSGNVPGVLYHHGEPNVHFSIDEVSLLPLIYTPDTHLLEVTFSDGQTRTAVVKEFQFNPLTDKCDHLDLQGMSANEKITIDVPVITTGDGVHGTRTSIVLSSIKESDELPIDEVFGKMSCGREPANC